MKNLLLLVVFFAMGIAVYAQQDGQYSFNMFNQLSYNPGYAGSNQAICASTIHRQQWVGFEGRPTSTVFHAHGEFNPLKIRSGVGISILQDNIGFMKTFGFKVNYAYRTTVSTDGVLGIGLGLGLQNNSFNGDWITPNGQNPWLDPAVPRQESHISPDLDFGAFFKSEKLWAGLSLTHLFEPKIKFDNGFEPNVTRHYYFVGGYNFLPDPKLRIMPSVFFKSDLATSQITLNTIVEYNRRFWGGVSYNIKDALTAMVGAHLNNGISFGYAYDFVMSDIGSYNSGSHEIFVRYCFNLSINKSVNRYKSVRFL